MKLGYYNLKSQQKEQASFFIIWFQNEIIMLGNPGATRYLTATAAGTRTGVDQWGVEA